MRDCHAGACNDTAQPDAASVFARAREQSGWRGVDMPVAYGFVQRLQGLLPATPAPGKKIPGLAFPRCDSVHTCFMRHPIDIAFIDARGGILELHKGVGPWRILRCRGAWGVMERLSPRPMWPTPCPVQARKEN